jgi:cell wall assembly regulator SMI1
MTSALSRWLESHAPGFHGSLADPLNDAVLAEAEALIGRKLPVDYVRFLRQHDGQRFVPGREPGIGTLSPIFRAFEILPLGYAGSEWRSMREWGEGMGDIEVDGPVRPLYVHDAWWPFTVIYGSSHHHCIDLDPAPGGDVGQIIVVSMKDDRRTVLAPSFDAFMERLVAILDDSTVAIEEEGIELSDDALDWLMGG